MTFQFSVCVLSMMALWIVQFSQCDTSSSSTTAPTTTNSNKQHPTTKQTANKHAKPLQFTGDPTRYFAYAIFVALPVTLIFEAYFIIRMNRWHVRRLEDRQRQADKTEAEAKKRRQQIEFFGEQLKSGQEQPFQQQTPSSSQPQQQANQRSLHVTFASQVNIPTGSQQHHPALDVDNQKTQPPTTYKTETTQRTQRMKDPLQHHPSDRTHTIVDSETQTTKTDRNKNTMVVKPGEKTLSDESTLPISRQKNESTDARDKQPKSVHVTAKPIKPLLKTAEQNNTKTNTKGTDGKAAEQAKTKTKTQSTDETQPSAPQIRKKSDKNAKVNVR